MAFRPITVKGIVSGIFDGVESRDEFISYGIMRRIY